MSWSKSKYKIRRAARLAGQPMKAREFMPYWYHLTFFAAYDLRPGVARTEDQS